MAIEFASRSIPLKRRLQTVSVLQWVYSFLALAQTCIVLFFALLFTRFWVISVLYAVWWFIDWDTPSQGGRKSPWLQKSVVWRYLRDYFPIKLIKTADLDPSKNYIIGVHPHGVLIAGGFTNFCTEATGFSDLYPGINPYLLMLPLWFRAPFFRDYIMCGGLIPSDKESASYVLRQKKSGTALVIAVGGAPEALDARPGACTILLKNRKGFIRLAIENGAHLVPAFSFGENDLFDQVDNPRGSLLRAIQQKLQKVMGVALPLFHARGVFQYSFGLIPYRKPINTVVGKPIPVTENPHPSKEEVDLLHKLYTEKLSELFEENKAHYNVPAERHLTIV
ncbi:2-acylglycerol O-acyltransferase 2 [Bufo bufo]|uniref:2-acylglycerol O-acyltransferase 2 n=1 Tax=Bufo bufo TaxID=8384 RepID=UPI001ABE8F51|nr:2-acylglycerol O-acyltransferase 2 [Bufo bufo]